jgi:hypothetical protein
METFAFIIRARGGLDSVSLLNEAREGLCCTSRRTFYDFLNSRIDVVFFDVTVPVAFNGVISYRGFYKFSEFLPNLPLTGAALGTYFTKDLNTSTAGHKKPSTNTVWAVDRKETTVPRYHY